MFLFNYTVESGHYHSSYDYANSQSTKTAIICGDTFTAKGLRAVVSNLNVFNILIAQSSLSKLCETFGDNVSLEMMSYIASIGPAFSKADLEELMLDLNYEEWVKEKLSKARGTVGLNQRNWVANLLHAEGFDAVLEKLGIDNNEKVQETVNLNCASLRVSIVKDGIVSADALSTDGVKDWIEFSAQQNAILQLAGRFDKLSSIPVRGEVSEELKKWENEYARITHSLEEDEEDYENYNTISVSLRPLVIPKEGIVVINESNSVDFYND